LPKIGGAEIAVHNVATNLVKMGVATTILTCRREKLNSVNLNYQINYYYEMPRGHLQGHVFLARLLLLHKKHKFDLIHVHKAQRAYYVLKIKNYLGVPIIITTHGGDIQRYPEINYGDRLNPKWNRRIEYAIQHADLLTAIGTSTRRHYSELGVPAEKIVDIPNGVDTERFNFCPINIKDQLGIEKSHFLLLSVGRYHIKKGYEFLLQAIPEILKYTNDFKMLIVGKKLEALNPLIKDLAIEPYVVLLEEQSLENTGESTFDFSKLPNDFLLSAYQSSDIYVSAALIEGFALTIVEAMAAGLPLVATNVEGNEDAVLPNENGILVPPKNPKELACAIIKLMKSSDLRQRYGEKSKRISKSYDWRLISKKYLWAYSKLINKIP
jgi:glycosyltransferase involved in cell wall biosynthesis